MKIYIFVRRFIGIDYHILSLSDLCLWVEKKIHQFYTFYPNVISACGTHWGYKIYNFLQMMHTKFAKRLSNGILGKKILTHDEQRTKFDP